MNSNQNIISLEGYKKSLVCLFDIKNTKIAAKKLLEMGDEQKELGNHEEARKKYVVALEVYRDEKNILGEALALKSIGDLWKMENGYPKARKYYWQALNKANIVGNRYMETNILHCISCCYQSEGSIEEAAKVLNKINELNLDKNQSKHKQQQSVLLNSHKINKLKNEFYNISPTRYQALRLISYTLIMLFGEITSNYYSTTWGIIIDFLLIISLITNSISTKSVKFSYLLQALLLLPLIRIMGSITVTGINPIYHMVILAVPIMAATAILIKNQNISRKKVGLTFENFPLQLIFGLSGIAFGVIEYLIIKPAVIMPDLNPFIPSNLINMLLASLIIVISTGLLQGLIFRGIIQRLAEPIMGNAMGLVFASVLFTILSVGWNSPLNVAFVFLISLYYGYIFQKSGSILGIGISLGLCNVVFYLIMPFLA